MKLGTVIFCNATKKSAGKKFQNFSFNNDGVTNYVNFFKKLCEKRLKYNFFQN